MVNGRSRVGFFTRLNQLLPIKINLDFFFIFLNTEIHDEVVSLQQCTVKRFYNHFDSNIQKLHKFKEQSIPPPKPQDKTQI